MCGREVSLGALRNKSIDAKVRVLVIDDDSTCLNVIAGMLKLFGYEVATTQNPLEAISTMYKKPHIFDLVLSDVHMPLMNGIELQRHIQKEFKIPVILMSGDEQRSTVMQGLNQGVEYFILKPPKVHELENLWQYAISNNQGEKAGESIERSISCMGMLVRSPNNDDEAHSLSSSKTEENLCLNYHDKQNRVPKDVEDVEIDSKSVSATNSKKPKRLVWTAALHNRFLDAVNIMGIDNAVPAKILEYMNVPGLTRVNVASHLQKYRIYSRKRQEKKNLMEDGRPFSSAFSWSEFPSLPTNNFLLNFSNAMNQMQPQPMQQPPAMPFLNIPIFAGSQILLNNTQANNIVNPMSNIGGSAVNDQSSYFTNQMNTQGSSILGGQNSFNSNTTGSNNQVVHNLANIGGLETVAMQSLSSNQLPPSHVNYQQGTTMPTQMGSVFGQSSGCQAAGGLSTVGFWDDIPLADGEFWNLPLPEADRGSSTFNNNGVALLDDNNFNCNNIQQGINQLQLQESLVTANVDPIAENNQVVVEQQAVNTSNLDNNIIPVAQQVPVVENNVNDTIQVTEPIEPNNQEMSNFDWVCGLPSDYQDITSLLDQDDISLDGFEDLIALFSSNDANNGNNNQTP